MTLDERARKIFAILQLPMDYDEKNGIPKGAYEAVLAELRSVVEEELENNCWVSYDTYIKAKSEAYDEMRRFLDEKLADKNK